MANMNKKGTTSSHSLATRITALVMSVLVASGVLVYLITLLVNLFS